MWKISLSLSLPPSFSYLRSPICVHFSVTWSSIQCICAFCVRETVKLVGDKSQLEECNPAAITDYIIIIIIAHSAALQPRNRRTQSKNRLRRLCLLKSWLHTHPQIWLTVACRVCVCACACVAAGFFLLKQLAAALWGALIYQCTEQDYKAHTHTRKPTSHTMA